ncbi:MAG: bifunctional (p)ppGpp synthetase/guanosine-3',5'-bis(diphosphate) 3'-pyrophosphohydrolase [Ruminococcaceae bacterium]|nr:bifunctional (p)ppGpp synthetase/guanosine-3',5'-bis(diphosphate) 3'-pyrophosphohydrolase [Oscillospiraceae bacterium]
MDKRQNDVTPEELYSQFITECEKSYSAEELAKIKLAYNNALKAHSAQFRYSGQPYIVHPLAVADILLKLGMDAESIEAALLHDTVEDTDITLDDIKKDFGADVANLVDGVTKLGKIPLSTKEEQQAENVRKMLLAMSEDIRVIIIKLADRLHNMRTLDYMYPQKRRDKALETLEIYAPLAHRLGIRNVKEELEDLAIRFLDPIAYEDISRKIAEMGKSGSEFLEQTRQKIEQRVSKIVSDARIDARIKSTHGIYRKMYMQNKSFNEIYDIYAIRIIVGTVGECYNCLGLIHDMYKPLPGRFKDYISTPKKNMYQSLHTTVIGKEGIPFEVQIRTREMHRTAEYGVAAHWKYKLGINGKTNMEERLAWVRQLLEEQQEAGDVRELVSAIKSDLVPDDTFVFTPKGDVITIPYGATVIDFAYAIHTAVGNKMIGAKVDGRIVPLDYQVKTGQIVEILTSSQQGKGPSRDWLNIAKTSSARTKIRSWFKNERRDENIVEGKAEIDREFRKNFIRLTDEEYTKFIENLARHQHCASVDDFYATIGYGGISLIRLMPYIKDEYNKNYKKQEAQLVKQTRKTGVSNDGVTVKGVDNVLVKLSKCCNPLPGDDIIGFITRGHGVSVHKRDCQNVPKNLADVPEPERWIEVSWNASAKQEFRAALQITGLSRIGLMADLSMQLAAMRVNINDISTREIKDGRSLLNMSITVQNLEHLNSVIQRLEKIDGILSVERQGF